MITYGGEEDKLFSTMSTDRDKATGARSFPGLKPKDCEQWFETWHKIHPQTRNWQRSCARKERACGYAKELLHDRRRYFPGGPDKVNAVPNMEVQALSSAITNQAVLKVAEKIKFGSWSEYTGLCLQVHDYIGVFVPDDKADYAIDVLKKCMPWSYGGMDFAVDEPKATRDWATQD